MLTTEVKQKIIRAMLANRPNFTGSDAGYATSLGINKSVYARLKKGETDRVLKDANFIHVARKLNVRIGDEPEFITANTPVFVYITKQLAYCQRESTTGIFCDKADIGKTHTAKEYVRKNPNAIYVDCSLVKSKQKLIRFIAKEFGVDHTGKYVEVFEDLVWYLKSIESPLIILDEAGDLDYPAFLELKALWNATENYTGWYMMGADGLRAKIDRGINFKKVGFAEIFSRYGARFQKVVPDGTEERRVFFEKQAELVIKINYPNVQDIPSLIRKTNSSLRRVRKEITKIKKAA